MTPTLRPYQHRLVDDTRVAFRDHRRVLAVSPTGSGKTVTLSYVTANAVARGLRVGIFAHRAELLRQIGGTLARFGVRHGRITAGQSFIARHQAYVISAPTYARAPERYPTFDLVIVDEAHHCTAGSTWDKCLQRSPDARVLGVTATPERLDGKGLGAVFDSMVLGPSTAELIRNGDLCGYRMFSSRLPEASMAGVRKVAGDYSRKGAAEVIDRPKITGDAVEHYRKHLAGKPSVAFCVSLEHAEHVASAFRAAGYTACRIDGEMKDDDRQEMVRDFEAGRINVMTSVDVISEGFDCPGIYGAILLRPTQSLSLYLQQVGRALRTLPGKDRAVILDHVGNIAHGLPCDHREWSLDGREAARRGEREGPGVRECGRCKAAFYATTRECPECGYIAPVSAREIEQVDGVLSEVASVDATQAVVQTKPAQAEMVLPGEASIDPAVEQKMREKAEAKKRAMLTQIARQKRYPMSWVDGIMAKGAGR